MERMIMMTEAEYTKLQDRIKNLKDELDDQIMRKINAQEMLRHERQRADKLWNLLNRQAIEELQAKHNAEYYRWCDEIAEKYEKLDEEEWFTNRARFYNNRISQVCEAHNCSEKDAELLRKYSNWLYKPDMPWDYEPTEGWSDLPYFKYSSSWILNSELDDIDTREKKAIKDGDKALALKYMHMLIKMLDAFTSDLIGKEEWLR